MDENHANFTAITGASDDVARAFLEMTANDFERAIQLYFENPDLASGVASITAPPVPAATRPNAGRQDDQGVIHIDSDDADDYDDTMQIGDSDDDDASGRAAAQVAAALAQEEEDAAMAKRLQEELYGGGGSGGAGGVGGGDDEVRAPIARTTETLVGGDAQWPGETDPMSAAFLDSMRRNRRAPRRGGGGPFSQRIWGDPGNPPANATTNSPHARRLEDLFRPPYDLMAGVSWDEARTLGKEDKKWIIVNLQDMTDFNCQALNRDVWKDEAVKELIQESFVFLQYDKDYPDAEEYLTFYFPGREHENPDNYPHVSIIDPRTGEQVKVWSGRPFPSARDFHAELAEFLDRYSLAANSKNPVAQSSAKKPQPVDVDRMTEEEMLEMALKNSMAGAESSRASSNPNIHDPDALTKASASGKGKEMAIGDGVDTDAAPVKSPWSKISSAYPHTEPANDPATTTRIQFRHSNGRVIRRFGLEEPVRRIYEWLKAEPLEGKEGVEFELKKMPQGQDLIEGLGKTIGDSGLKQGTVMIEFLED